MFRAFLTRVAQRIAPSAPLASRLLLLLCFFLAATLPVPAQGPGDEIVANLAGGRVIVHAARDVILFAAINQPVESDSVPPRVVALDFSHIGVLLGASEWRIPFDPKPIRMDRDIPHITARDSRYAAAPDEGETDLETIGTAFLEKLRPLVGQLHHKLDFPADEPIFEMVVIGYGPSDYGPEVWDVEYRMEQEQVATRGEEYWQTRIQRPRFTQLYPPEKHAPHTLIETRYPPRSKGPTLAELIQGNDPRLGSVLHDPRFEKVLENLRGGTAQKAPAAESVEFLRAALPLIAGNASFVLGKLEDQGGLNWIVPPSEPVEKVQQQDKNRPPEAPTLRRPIKP